MRTLASKVVGADSSPSVAQRRNHLFFAFFLLLCSVIAIQGCGKKSKPTIQSLDDLNKSGVIVAGEADSFSYRIGQEAFPKAATLSFDEAEKMFSALKDGSADAVSYDRLSLEYYAATDSEYHLLDDVIGNGTVSLVAPIGQNELIDQINEFIALFHADRADEDVSIKWNGALKPENVNSKNLCQDMSERWFKEVTSRTLPAIPRPEKPRDGKTYVVGIANNNQPFSFKLDDVSDEYLKEYGEISGFEAELIRRLALFMNIEVEIKSIPIEGLCDAVLNSEVDVALGSLNLTPEQSSALLVSKSFIDLPVGVMILANRWKSKDAGASLSERMPLTVDKMTFSQRLQRSFEKTFIVERRWLLFLKGLLNTIYITAVATALGTLLAFVQCYMRRSRLAWLRYPAKVYIAIMQGTPILVILLVLYYVVFTKVSLTGELVAAIALALNFAAYAGEQMRTGVDGIDQGLLEAARALGFGRFDVFRKIIFPIACRRIMPVYKGEFISLLKTTSIVGYVAIQDLTKASDIVRGRTYEAFFPLIATAIIYLLTAHLMASGFAYLEYRLNPVTRRKRAKGEVNV